MKVRCMSGAHQQHISCTSGAHQLNVKSQVELDIAIGGLETCSDF